MLSVNRYNFNTFQTSAKKIGVTKPPVKNTLSIFYGNDYHGNTDKLHLVVESSKAFQEQKKDVPHLIVSAGDNVSGGDCNKNELVYDILQNGAKLDVTVPGNHEFDGYLLKLIENAKLHKTQFVATNVDFDDDSEVRNYIKRSTVIEKNGQKFGLIGAMPLDFETCTKKSVQEGVEVMDYDDTIKALQKEVNNLREQGINKIILLSHTGYENDKKMASDLDGVDIIIGGHSHSVVEGAVQGENIIQSKSNQPVIITQAGENGKYYGILDVEFDADGVLTKISNQLTEVSSKKSPTIEYIKEQKLGTSPTIGRIKEIEQMPKNRRIKPHAWANLVVDSMRAEFGADCAFLNAANVRKVPTEGKLTERDIVESVPMKNRLIRTKITQKQVVEAISNAARESLGGETGEPGLLFASGFTYKVTEKGELLELNFIDKKGKINPIDIKNPSEKITYDAIYDDFTMRADGEYPALAPKGEVQYFEYDKDKTAINYISKLENKDNLELSDDNRLEIVQTSQPQQQNSSKKKFLSLTLPKVS